MATPNRLTKGEIAVGSINLDEGINDTDYVQFTTSPTSGIGAQGEMHWNPTYRTLDVHHGNDVVQQVGQETYILVKNVSGGTLTAGTAIYATGASGINVNVIKAQASGESTSSKTLAVMTEDVLNGNTGFATTLGIVNGIDTSTLTEGAGLWLSPTVAGGLTTTKPSAPNHAVSMGVCLRSQQVNGAVFVRIINGFELEELHNVSITSPQDGQVLQYQASTGLWINATP